MRVTLKNRQTEAVTTIHNVEFLEITPEGAIRIKFMERTSVGYMFKNTAYDSRDYSVRAVSTCFGGDKQVLRDETTPDEARRRYDPREH